MERGLFTPGSLGASELKASVIVPCYACEDVIGAQLEALSKQQLSQPWEVILVDNGGNTNLTSCAVPYRVKLPRLRVVAARGKRGAAHARNVGARAAQGELLLFADADNAVGEGWLAAMVAALENNSFAA